MSRSRGRVPNQVESSKLYNLNSNFLLQVKVMMARLGLIYAQLRLRPSKTFNQSTFTGAESQADEVILPVYGAPAQTEYGPPQ